MPTSRDSRIVKIVLVIFFLFIIGYGIFEAQGLLNGPVIDISGRAMLVSQPYVEITGTTSHIAELQMNGASVPVTQAGVFDVPYVLSPGYNRIVLDAQDKYGKKAERVIEIVYQASSTPSAVPATSSALTMPGASPAVAASSSSEIAQ